MNLSKLPIILIFLSLLQMAEVANADKAADFVSPDILILGDSQLPFGAGPQFLTFFEHLVENCGFKPKVSGKLGRQSVAVIGVRSSSLGTWTKRSKSGKSAICTVDPKWKVNAGSFGTVNRSNNIYVQIGQGRDYQFCTAKKSAFEAMFKPDYYDPKLLVLNFLGNSSATWANNPKSAIQDVEAAINHLPKHIPCVYMTTAPPYQNSIVQQRLKAQENLKAAFSATGNRCAFVDGFTTETIKINQGVSQHFRRAKSGKVKDPFHPNQRAAQLFFRARHGAICDAIASQLR